MDEQDERNLGRTTRGEMIAIYALCILLLTILGVSWLWQRGFLRSAPAIQHTDKKRPPQPIDLNSADGWELQLLPHIGEKRAPEIIKLRKRLHGFTSVDQLTEIPGITRGKVDEMREFVRVGPYDASSEEP